VAGRFFWVDEEFCR